MRYQSIAIIFLAVVQHSLCNDHSNAIENPVLRYLNLKPNTRHEFINIELPERARRAIMDGGMLPPGTHLKIRPFGGNINLWLYPKESTVATDNTPVYYSRYSPNSPGKVSITRQARLWDYVSKVMQDPVHRASMIFGKDEYGRPRVNGRIDSRRLGIRYLPPNVVRQYARQRREIGTLDDNFSDSMNHVVYEIDEDSERGYSISALNETVLQNRVARSTGGIPSTIYPKILIIVQNALFNALGRYISDVLEYVAILINAVDLKYRSLENPNIRLFLAGIVIGVDPESTPYISDYMITPKAFDVVKAMPASQKFFYVVKKSIPMLNYDVALTLTPLEFGVNGMESVVGQAWPLSVCKDSEREESMRATSIVYDEGLFSGVFTATHELGHTFGAFHDNKEMGPCSYENGFVMTVTVRQTTNSSMFSRCSIEEFQKFMEEDGFSCMYKKPAGYMRPRLPPILLPGRTKYLKKMCEKKELGEPCYDSTHSNICTTIHCKNSKGACVSTGEIALSGMVCGEKDGKPEKYCIHNECVKV